MFPSPLGSFICKFAQFALLSTLCTKSVYMVEEMQVISNNQIVMIKGGILKYSKNDIKKKMWQQITSNIIN